MNHKDKVNLDNLNYEQLKEEAIIDNQHADDFAESMKYDDLAEAIYKSDLICGDEEFAEEYEPYIDEDELEDALNCCCKFEDDDWDDKL